jgi:hypothetical protein
VGKQVSVSAKLKRERDFADESGRRIDTKPHLNKPLRVLLRRFFANPRTRYTARERDRERDR